MYMVQLLLRMIIQGVLAAMNEKEAKQIAFEKLSKIDNVRIVNHAEYKKLGFNPVYDLWEIITEISVYDNLYPITIYIYFSTTFPIEIPKVYVSVDTFAKLKYIPHLDNNRLVCTFDNELIKVNPNEPFGIINECIARAKRILVDGLQRTNLNDFITEFKAYWEETYDHESKPKKILSLIDILNIDADLKLICLESSLMGFSYVLHKSDNTSYIFKDFLKDYNLKYKEVNVFYLYNFPLFEPPFNYTNRNILDFVKAYNSSQFQEFNLFIRRNEYPKLVITKKEIANKDFIFGWFHRFLSTNRKGFRPGSLSPLIAFTTFQSIDKVERIFSETFTSDRLENRTSGDITHRKHSFAIAGLGSIGSNLVFFLNSFERPKFCFIDDDLLKIENINRHFLGFSSIGNFKTKALADWLRTSNPLQEIISQEKSIIEVVDSEPDCINSFNYLFSCIGNFNIENWIFESLKTKTIKIPVFFIWVEPYLVGGHCLYIHPDDLTFEDYFEDGYFKNNIIPKDEYTKPGLNFAKREAGCQTTFTPYSSINVISFLSQLFPKISSIIETNSQISTSFTWFGYLEKLNQLGVTKSKFADNIETGQLIQTTF